MADGRISTVTEVKEWLRYGKSIARERQRLLDEKYQALEVRGITTITRPLTKKLSRRTPDRNDSAIISYCDKTAETDREIAECERFLADMRKPICEITHWVWRVLLLEHYLECKNLYDIGSDFGISARTMSRHHKRAIEELTGILASQQSDDCTGSCGCCDKIDNCTRVS